MVQLAPSLLAADFAKLGENVSAIEKAGADFLHVDVMDGHFVPNISFGAAVMKKLAAHTKLPFDVHLMIENPERYIADFVTDQTAYITVHQETCPHLHRTIQYIQSLGVQAGVSLNPATSHVAVEYVLADVDLVLVMSVNPGFGGQQFIPDALDKIAHFREIRERRCLKFKLQVDGGVDLGNVQDVIRAGADIIVAGSAVFQEEKIEENTRAFLRLFGRTVQPSASTSGSYR